MRMGENSYKVFRGLLETIVGMGEKIDKILHSGKSYSEKEELIKEELQKTRGIIESVDCLNNEININISSSQGFQISIKEFCDFEKKLFNKRFSLNIKNKYLEDSIREAYSISIRDYPPTGNIKQLFLSYIDDYETRVLEELRKYRYLSRKEKKKRKSALNKQTLTLFLGICFIIGNLLPCISGVISVSISEGTKQFFDKSTEVGHALIIISSPPPRILER